MHTYLCMCIHMHAFRDGLCHPFVTDSTFCRLLSMGLLQPAHLPCVCQTVQYVAVPRPSGLAVTLYSRGVRRVSTPVRGARGGDKDTGSCARSMLRRVSGGVGRYWRGGREQNSCKISPCQYGPGHATTIAWYHQPRPKLHAGASSAGELHRHRACRHLHRRSASHIDHSTRGVRRGGRRERASRWCI